MNNTFKAHLALIGANLIYGVTYSVAKQVIPVYLSPFALVFLRISGATLLFWAASLLIPRERIEHKDIGRIFLASLFGASVNQSLFLNGISITTPIDASIIMTITPILVLLVSRILIKEPITLFKIIGIAMGATGAILLLTYRSDARFGSNNILGNSLIIANATSYSFYLVIIKPLLQKYHPITLMKWIFLFGLIIVSGPGIPAVLKIEWAALPNDIIFSVLYIVIGNTFLAYLLNLYSLRFLKPITAGIYIYSQPLVATAVALILGQDVITAIKVMSAMLIFAGVYFVSYSSSKTGRSL